MASMATTLRELKQQQVHSIQTTAANRRRTPEPKDRSARSPPRKDSRRAPSGGRRM